MVVNSKFGTLLYKELLKRNNSNSEANSERSMECIFYFQFRKNVY